MCNRKYSKKSLTAVLSAVAMALWPFAPAEGQVKLPGPAGSGDEIGWSVSVDGDFALVGAHLDDDNGTNAGAAYVFERSGCAWNEVAKLKAVDGAAGDGFGISVSISGNRAVIGAPGGDQSGPEGSGTAWVFERQTNGSCCSWTEIKMLTAGDGEQDDHFGGAVAISGDVIVIGAPADDDNGNRSGSAYVFERNQGGLDNWGLVTKLLGAPAGSRLGLDVSISGDVALIGAPAENAAYVFKRNTWTWTQRAKLTTSDSAPDDYFGYAVSIDGGVAVVGDYAHEGESGAAYVFEEPWGGWANMTSHTAKLDAPNLTAWDNFGYDVSISGNTVVVAAALDEGAGAVVDSGVAYVFKKVAGTWTLIVPLIAPDGAADDWFGTSVSISGGTIVIGAPWHDAAGSQDGAVYVFDDIDGDGVCGDVDDCPFLPNSADTDGDGIFDTVDNHPCEPSIFFSDGPLGGVTSGTVTNPGPAGAPGFSIVDRIILGTPWIWIENLGRDPMPVFSCSRSIWGTTGSYVVKCGSVFTEVLAGELVVTFTIEGITHAVEVVAGGSATFEETLDELGELAVMTVTPEGPAGSTTLDGSALPIGEPTIIVANEPPTAVAGDPLAIHVGDTVFLDGSDSFDDNDDTEDLVYAWTLTTVPAGSAAQLAGAATPTPSFVADVPGVYEASLVVTDTQGLPSALDTVTISSLNLAPVADAGSDSGTFVGNSVQLDGSGCSDPDGDPIVSYAWLIAEAPDGSTAALVDAASVTPAFTPDLVGAYHVQLIASDGFDDSAPDEVVVYVISVDDFAGNNTMQALNSVGDLPEPSVTTKGNQIALGNFLTQAIKALQRDDTAAAINKLSQALMRTDGCALRGEPDGNGPGRDWITGCAEQAMVYQLLSDALDALTP